MNRSVLETLIGFIVILLSVFFVWFTYQNTEMDMGKNNYEIFAKFENISGINEGSDVKIGGVKIGQVVSRKIDPKNYMINLKVAVQNGINIPSDSTMSIVSDGLLGGKYISVNPGSDSNMLKSGGEIMFTQSSINIEALIGKMMFNADEKK